jgi:hypothetical protein
MNHAAREQGRLEEEYDQLRMELDTFKSMAGLDKFA